MTLEEKELKITYNDSELNISCLLREGDKEVLLFIHGLGCSKNDFTAVDDVDGLKGHKLVLFDFPGCGTSPYPFDLNLGMDNLVEVTHKVKSELDLENVVLIGHSMGGLVSLLYAGKYEENVKAFINVEGNLVSENSNISRKVAKISFDQFSEHVFPKLHEKLLATENTGFIRHAEILSMYSSPRAFYDYSPSLMRYSDDKGLIERYIRLKVPTLYLYGSENSDLSYIPRLVDSGCEVAEISNSNHFPFYDNPYEFYKVVSGFINGLSLRF
ncbi:MAG: alpha/beta hydrolase [Halobacteriota archaeon]|nr:alpha/beta hydrolase [Halobacteriota archaeon]